LRQRRERARLHGANVAAARQRAANHPEKTAALCRDAATPHRAPSARRIEPPSPSATDSQSPPAPRAPPWVTSAKQPPPFFPGFAPPACCWTGAAKPGKKGGHRVGRCPSPNPNGISASSPRLRGTSYLGFAAAEAFQPGTGCGPGDDKDTTRLRLRTLELVAPLFSWCAAPAQQQAGAAHREKRGVAFLGGRDPGRRSFLACPGLLSYHPYGISIRLAALAESGTLPVRAIARRLEFRQVQEQEYPHFLPGTLSASAITRPVPRPHHRASPDTGSYSSK
jgi:hypothetical protein